MRIENLISKYLDSELTPGEDIVLREMLANDPISKSIFNDAVDVDYLIREDARQIKVPDDLSSEVEDRVMMMILAEMPEKTEIHSPNKRRKLNIRPVLALFISLAFSLNFFGLDELGFGNNNFSDIEKTTLINSETENVSGEIVALDNENITSKNNSENNIESEITPIEFSKPHNPNVKIKKEPDLVLSRIERVIESSENEINTSDNNISALSNPLVSNAFEGMRFNTFANNMRFNPAFAVPGLRTSFHQKEFNFENLRFVGLAQTDFATKGIHQSENALIASVSQKILYKTSENSFLGIEFGYSEYYMKSRKDILIPYYEIESGNYKGDIQGVKTNFGIKTNVEQQETYSTYFAAVVYQKSLFKKSIFELNAGAGLGASGDGLLGKLTLIGTVELFSGIRFTAGIETKMMSINLARFENNSDEFRSASSFVYGLDFNF